ncbi:MAG: ATP-binding protein, partial [Nitrospiraceae bacterium]
MPQEVLSLTDVIAETEPLLRQITGRDIQLTRTLSPGLGRIKASPKQIRELLHQLTINAREAMPQGGRLTIAADNIELDAVQADCQVGSLRPGPCVRLTVSDTGIGMDPETRARLSEPFFTSKEGTWLGLGLAVVYGIVVQSGGSISVVSAPGQGTTFTVYWPRADQSA